MTRHEPTGFVVRRRGRSLLMADARLAPALERLRLLEPDALERLARGEAGGLGRAPSARVALGDRHLHVRRLRRGGVLGPWLGGTLLGSRRPLRELAITARLRAAGAPVPRPAFALVRRRLGPVSEAALATVFEEGARDLLAFLESDPEPTRVADAAAAAGRAVRTFHDAGGRHADLHLKNLLLRERGGRVECVVVDLDRARLAHPGPGRRMTELMRLHRSLVKRRLLERVGRRGLARFFAAYVAGDRTLRRALRGRLRRERVRLALHAWRW